MLFLTLIAAEAAVSDEPPKRLSNKVFLSDAFVEHTRGVIGAVVEQAKNSKLTGDARTEQLVRAAASRWHTIPEAFRAHATILGLGVAMDATTQLRDSVVTERFWKRYETDDERAARLEVLGEATMHGRRDLSEHFFVCAALTALTTPQIAETMGILKEVADSNGGTGFSFKDLAADLAGILYAQKLMTMSDPSDSFLEAFEVTTFMPTVSDLNEGIMVEELRAEFMINSEDRFRAEVEAIRARVLALPIHSKGPEDATTHVGPASQD